MKNAILSTRYNWLAKLFHPITLSLVVTLVSVWFVFPEFAAYKVDEISKSPHIQENKKATFFSDLNHDGKIQILTLLNPTDYNPAAIYFTSREKGNGVDQFNYRGEWLKYGQILLGDYNNNGFDEIYAFNSVGDSLFLNITEAFLKNGINRRNIFIDISPAFKKDKHDIELTGAELHDIDKDGNKELLFVLHAGYSKSPRAFYVYDIDTDSMYKSADAGSGLMTSIQFKDVNEDGFPEVTGYSSSPCNYKLPIPYPDTSSWLIVYTKDAEFLFPPVELPHKYSSFISDFVEIEGESYLISLCFYELAKDKTMNHEVRLYDLKGNLIKAQLPQFDDKDEVFKIIYFNQRKNQTYLITNKGGIYSFDVNLNLKLEQRLSLEENESITTFANLHLDLDANGYNEFILRSDKRGIIILSDDFKHLTRINNKNYRTKWNTSLAYSDGKQISFGINSNDSFFEYRYYKNPYAWLKFPLIILIFVLSYLFFYFLVKIQKRQWEKRLSEEKQIHKYQYQGLRNQLDPHFTLNILNAIQSLFCQKDFDKAKYLLSKYGKLNRNALMNAEKIAISLENELDFVENFLALEKFRHEDRFDYFIKVDKEIDVELIQLPRMLIHTFAENAIKHGLFHKSEGGFLKIEIKENENSIQINIEDNGVGRAKSKELKTTNNGRGLSIIHEIVKLYNKLQKAEITYMIIDLFEENKAVGTRVEVLMPINTKT